MHVCRYVSVAYIVKNGGRRQNLKNFLKNLGKIQKRGNTKKKLLYRGGANALLPVMNNYLIHNSIKYEFLFPCSFSNVNRSKPMGCIPSVVMKVHFSTFNNAVFKLR